MQKDGGLICQQPVKLFLSSKIEMQNVITAARGKPPVANNPGSNPNIQSQQASLSQAKRPDQLSQQFTHDVDENQHSSQSTAQSSGQNAVTNEAMSSFLDAVNKMQQQKAANVPTTSLNSSTPSTTSALSTGQASAGGASNLAPANLVLQLLQSNLGSLPPNLLAQFQGQLSNPGLQNDFTISLISLNNDLSLDLIRSCNSAQSNTPTANRPSSSCPPTAATIADANQY